MSKSVTIVRPGMLGCGREEFLIAERIVLPIATRLHPFLPRGFRVNPAANIAEALVDVVTTRKPGPCMVTSRNLA